MIQAFKVINESGDELMVELARPEKSGFAVRSISGLGPVKASINLTELATSDGGVYNSSRIPSRNIVIDLTYFPLHIGDDRFNFNSDSESESSDLDPDPDPSSPIYTGTVDSEEFGRRSYEYVSRSNSSSRQSDHKEIHMDIEDLRQLSYKYFPIKRPIILIFYTTNRQVYIQGYVESNEPDIFSSDEGATISIVCPYPYFRDINQDEFINFSSTDPRFKFEFANVYTGSVHKPRLLMSMISNAAEQNINYSGDIDTGVVITIYLSGRIGDITVYNGSLSQQFKLKVDKIESIINSPISSGDKIVISSLPRNKYVRYYKENVEFNILSAVDKESDWLMISRGNNLYTYSAESGSNNITLEVSYPILYEGI